MHDLIKILSSYNIFTNLLPGSVFCLIATKITNINLIQSDVTLGFFFYYFVGLIISRIGSLFIEEPLKFLRILRFSDYKDYLLASKKDSKIAVFVEILNIYRNFVSMGASLLVLYLIQDNQIFIQYKEVGLLVFIIFLFGFSKVKQNTYINKRIEHNLKMD